MSEASVLLTELSFFGDRKSRSDGCTADDATGNNVLHAFLGIPIILNGGLLLMC